MKGRCFNWSLGLACRVVFDHDLNTSACPGRSNFASQVMQLLLWMIKVDNAGCTWITYPDRPEFFNHEAFILPRRLRAVPEKPEKLDQPILEHILESPSWVHYVLEWSTDNFLRTCLGFIIFLIPWWTAVSRWKHSSMSRCCVRNIIFIS